MQRWNGCLGLTTTDCLSQLGIFHLPKLKIITIGNLPVKPPQRSDLNQQASLIPGAIHTARAANNDEVRSMRSQTQALKEAVADLTLEC